MDGSVSDVLEAIAEEVLSWRDLDALREDEAEMRLFLKSESVEEDNEEDEDDEDDEEEDKTITICFISLVDAISIKQGID